MNFRLTRTYKSRPKCKEVVCKCEHVGEPRFATAISSCSLHLVFCILHLAFGIVHLAFCILHFAFYKICRWQKQTFPNAFTKSMCNCVMLCRVANRTPRASTALNIHMQPEMTKPRRLPLAALLNFILDILLSKETHHACSFCKVFASGHLQDAKLSSSVLAHCWLSNLFAN